MRKCVWKDEDGNIKVSDLAPGPDYWRFDMRSEKVNYPNGRECRVCHGV